MAATAFEVVGRSGQIDDGGVESVRPWVALNAADEAEATAAVALAAPATLGGMVLDTIGYAELVETAGLQHYECEVIYRTFKRRSPPAVGDSQYNFDISVQPVRVVIPLGPNQVYKRSSDPLPIPAEAPNWMIGDQGTGDGPEGCDVFEPVITFSETHWVPLEELTLFYRNTILRLVGKVNDFSFKGFDEGEVLVAGISGAQRGREDAEMTFRFMVRENLFDFEAAGIRVDFKEGWQHLWPRHYRRLDGDTYTISNAIQHMVVSDVFRKGNLGNLGIGT